MGVLGCIIQKLSYHISIDILYTVDPNKTSGGRYLQIVKQISATLLYVTKVGTVTSAGTEEC